MKTENSDLYRLPTDYDYQRSNKMLCDRYYKLPKEIECFIQRANKELPIGVYLKPWTLNLAVTLFKEGVPICVFPYEGIEGRIVELLDRLKTYYIPNALAHLAAKEKP